MGMRVSSGSSAGQAGAAAWQQRQQDFQALSKALQSNNLDAAKSAYADLTKNASSQASSNSNSPLAQIGKALQSGDLAGAQKALSAMKSHHHRNDGDSDDAASGAPQPAAAPSSPTATLGNNLNVVA